MNNTRRGFTLLEVLVATAIMSLAVAGVLSGLAAAARNTGRLTQYDRATLLARYKMDELLADETLPHKIPIAGRWPPAQLGGAEAGWQAMVTVFETPQGAGSGNAVIDRVELEVWWMDGATRHSFALEGFRRAVFHQEDANVP